MDHLDRLLPIERSAEVVAPKSDDRDLDVGNLCCSHSPYTLPSGIGPRQVINRHNGSVNVRSDPGRIAVIGLGLMGSRMAKRLLERGFVLSGYDPGTAQLEAFEDLGGLAAGSPAEAVEGCWAALLSLPDYEISRQASLGDRGIALGATGPLVVYDTSTGRPSDAVNIAEALVERDITYCDSTVSGNSKLAETGSLVVMMGGPVDAYRQGRPVFEAIGRSHHHMGPVGSGARMKLVVNHLLTVHRMALAEALVVAELADMDLRGTLEVLKDSLAYSKAMDAWGEPMIAGDHRNPYSRLRQSHKDARLIVEHGKDLGASVELVTLVRDALAEGERSGLADLDNSSIIEVIRRRAGLGRRA